MNKNPADGCTICGIGYHQLSWISGEEARRPMLSAKSGNVANMRNQPERYIAKA